MRKIKLLSKIFIDGGDPIETREAKRLLGFIDGQTTNPTLISQNPIVQKTIKKGKKFTQKEIYYFYKEIVEEMAIITLGPISIEVYADKNTKAKEMLKQAQEMVKWISNPCIKFPITKEGLKAAELAVKMGVPLNMTLCFSQEQAAAVYAATSGAKKPIFISPFVGRLDDRGENGMNLIENILKMYQKGDGHVLPLVASVRNLDHLLFAIKIGSPAITVPFQVIKKWAKTNFILPDKNFSYQPKKFKNISYEDIPLDRDWQDYNINHSLTEVGLERFSTDWKKILK